jgi:hypothetical protein
MTFSPATLHRIDQEHKCGSIAAVVHFLFAVEVADFCELDCGGKFFAR